MNSGLRDGGRRRDCNIGQLSVGDIQLGEIDKNFMSFRRAVGLVRRGRRNLVQHARRILQAYKISPASNHSPGCRFEMTYVYFTTLLCLQTLYRVG